MALSEYEKNVLKDMESHLREDDPDLASTFTDAESSISQGNSLGSFASTPASYRLSPRRITGGVVLILCGLGIILLSMTFGHGWLTVACAALGFIAMVCGVLFALSNPTRPKRKRKSDIFDEPMSSRKKRSSGFWERFQNNQQKRWDERRGDN